MNALTKVYQIAIRRASTELRRAAVSFLMEVFYSLAEATTIVEIRRQSYNHERPDSSLGCQTPVEFAAAWQSESKPNPE